MKILLLIAPENFRDEEFSIPKSIFEKAGADITVASLKRGMCKGMLGMNAEPDILLSEASIDEYDALVIAGGMGSKAYLWNNKEVIQTAKEFYSQGKVLAAICLSGVVLANAGILKGKNATVFPSKEAVQILREKGANYKDSSVITDGKIITARGPEDADQFAREILKVLSK